MKASLATLALINSASAIKVLSAPDVYGKNGKNYTNNNADQELAKIGVDITKEGNQKAPMCSAGNWARVQW